MEFAGVYHKTSEQMSYPLDEERLVINLKTGYDVKRVFIHHGDPFEAGILGGNEKWTGKREEIVYKKRLPHQLWWTTTLIPPYKRCKYYFELQTEKEVWYQIFPDRFCNGTPEKKDADIVPWQTGKVTNKEKYGGDLEGIRRKLPYLQDLGITGIYLNPIMEAETNHKYDTTDYTKIDPSFGDDGTMRHLVSEAHDRGIRIMVDAVFNHCGRKFAPWLDVQEKGRESTYADWMPKLNTNNEEVIRYFCQVCEGWIRKYDIDGIRFDVGNEVSHRFLKRMREHLKKIKPDIYLLGEIWHDASQWLTGDEYDSVMNYPLMSGIHDFFLDQTMGKEEFENMVNRCYTMYMQQNNNVLFNLLDSHDTERLMNRFHDLDKFYQQLAVLFTLPGSPCIYYGTEIAMEGGFDPDCRRCMPWDEIGSEENRERIGQMKKLIRLRKEEETFRSLHFHFPGNYENPRCVEYIKLDEEGQKTEILLNCSEVPVKVKGTGEVLFARNYQNGILEKNGTLIRRT